MDTSFVEQSRYCDPDASATDQSWAMILSLCATQEPIGFGPLDSFLSDPDLERRISLVENEAQGNEWLRLELRDTLSQGQDWTAEQYQRLRRVAAR